MLSRYSYLLFHSLVEMFSIFVAFAIFVIAWNSRRFWQNGCFLFLGIAYLYVGGLDLLHTLGYKGMGVFPGRQAETNLATQLWISARYLESVSLLAAPAFLGRTLQGRRLMWAAGLLMAAFAGVFVAVVVSIFALRIFPTCFDERTGLTTVKRVSEYVISGIFAGAIALLWAKRRYLDRRVLALTVASVAVSIPSELSFTLYAHAYGLPNLIGHFLKLASFYLIYRAIVQTALAEPYDVLFRDLKQAEEGLRRARDELELRVTERTAELRNTVEALQGEVRDRQAAEEQLDRERRTLFSVLRVLPGFVALIQRDHTIRFANDKFLELFGVPGKRPCYAVQRGQDEPCDGCSILQVLDHDVPAEWEWTGADGQTFHVWGYPFADLDGTRLVLQLGIDITERKRLEAEVLKASETEKQRIGRDLHDSLGQMLSGVACLSQVLHRRLRDRCVEEADAAAQIESIVAESVDLTRSLSHGLNPVGLQPDSLMVALKELAASVESMFGVRCVFQCERPVLVDDSLVATHLYRIAQEATSNAARHGRASRITVTLARPDRQITLRIEDDGVGLPEDAPHRDGMGLRIMRYRGNTIGAVVQIGRRRQGGTVVTCRLPGESRRRGRHA